VRTEVWAENPVYQKIKKVTFEQKEKNLSAMDVNRVQGCSRKQYVWAAATRIAYITKLVEIIELSGPSDASNTQKCMCKTECKRHDYR